VRGMRTLARERDVAEILGRLRALRPDGGRRWGRMSANQMVVHLADSFAVAAGRRPARGVPGLLGRTLLKWFALYVPLPWPAAVATTPEVDAEREGSPPVEFAPAAVRRLAGPSAAVSGRGASRLRSP
jgi:hypothetical protein